jgi:hypothetical protein
LIGSLPFYAEAIAPGWMSGPRGSVPAITQM